MSLNLNGRRISSSNYPALLTTDKAVTGRINRILEPYSARPTIDEFANGPVAGI
jgi:hypothetical protein